MRYKIIFRERAKRSIKSIPKTDNKRIFEAIMQLSNNPYPRGYKKLKGRNAYRIRQGNYRIIYEVNKKEIWILILAIGDRKNIYRR